MRRAAFVAAVVAALLPAGVAGGALDDCVARIGAGGGIGAGDPARRDLSACVNAARRAATGHMLESFLALDQALGGGAGRGPTPALRQSQRDFERYLQSHCGLAQRAAADGGAIAPAQIGCEADLLRERAAQLKRLLPPARSPEPGAAAAGKD